MTNVPPPDPNSSRLSFDELIGIVIAFATIGTILAVTLTQKNPGFNLSRFLKINTNPQTTKPIGDLPLLRPTASPETTPLLRPTTSLEATPLLRPTTSLEATPLLRQENIIAPSESAAPTIPLTASPRISTATPEKVSSSEPPTTEVNSTPKYQASPAKTSATTKPVTLTDVPENLWARPYIEVLATQGIVRGFPNGTFNPGGSITRAEFAVLLQKAFEQKSKLEALNYKDVTADFWASSAIEETVKTGFLRGYPGNVFQPNQPITRVQAIVALANGLGLSSTNAAQDVLKNYQDANRIPDYAKAPVSAATKSGLVVNYPNPNVLNPNQNISRAEVAALVYQALTQSGKVEPIPSNYVVQP